MDVLDLVKDGNVKRIFRARNKIVFPGAFCHITQRAVGSEPLFLEEGDYLYMLHLIKGKSKEFNFKVFAFVLMPNHIHILIQIADENLSEAMKNIFELYAMYFNNKYERKGHLFCGAYRCAICLDDSYLLASSLYIHLNPARARLVNESHEYRWSSCNLYLNSIKKKTFLNYGFILSILDGDIKSSCEIYKSLLNELQKEKANDTLENVKALELFRGNFLNIIDKKFHEAKLKTFLKEFNFISDKKLDIKIKELLSKGKLRKPQDIAARKFLIEQLTGRGFTKQEIAEKLNISIFSIYRTLNAKNR